MAIRRFSDKELTMKVPHRIRKTKNPRLKQVMTSFIATAKYDFVLMPVKPVKDVQSDTRSLPVCVV